MPDQSNTKSPIYNQCFFEFSKNTKPNESNDSFKLTKIKLFDY